METSRPKFLSYPGAIRLIRNDNEMANVDLSGVTAWGFDTETRPSFKSGDNFRTALLQLASDSEAYLFRLHHITKFEMIKTVLENEEILKVGAAISHDLKQLQRIFAFKPKGFVEIQKVAKEKGLKNQGLKGMTEEVFGLSLAKKTKMTNWENRELTREQLMYAATDAWIGLALYRELTRSSEREQSSK